ncbi:MAG: phenylalanine--tRNA ligase subunit alpha [Patescibacteria group bacterium]|nr:phenylalanine--tRNA ligase subunit alpha [Patescibacteria group bacterium]
MQKKLDQLKGEFLEKLNLTKTERDLEKIYMDYFGRKGKLTEVFKDVKNVAVEEKPIIGKIINDIKIEAEKVYSEMKETLTNNKQQTINNKQLFDPTVPGTLREVGSLHPTTIIKNELNDAFRQMGFEIYDPAEEITSEGYAFDSMNFPPDHPARESMDTFWIKQQTTNNKQQTTNGFERLCLRPHLTGASVRFMQTHQPPFRFVYPGRVFRSEATDAGHEATFYQYEALIVDDKISFSAGKILVKAILERVFGKEIKIRMRAGFFPFVEPGFEIDMECQVCGGKGCSVCKHKGWVEIMPGGAPHPNVLKAGGLDPKKWQGFYINVGLDRLAMMKFGIDDIRLMHSGDLRFLKQF